MIRIQGKVLCAGNLTRDILVWPVDQVIFDTTVWVKDIVTSFGGNGANTVYAIGRLGTGVRLVGLIGEDEAGDRILVELGGAGVELRVGRCALPTPATVVIVRGDGARSFLHRPGASSESFAEPLEFPAALVESCAHFHLANPFAMPKMRPQASATLERARAAGLTTSLDTGWDAMGQWLEVIGPCLPHLDLLFVNLDEAEKLSGCRGARCAAAFFRDRGVASIVVKLGAGGCAVFDGADDIHVPGFRVAALDSTGAGDCFAGAFLAGLQRSLAPGEAARLANAAGALSVQRPGATTGLMGYDDTVRWMAEQG